MCHAESGTAVRHLCPLQEAFCDTLQTVEDALSLWLRESWPLPSSCPFELESERKERGKEKGEEKTTHYKLYWVLGPLVGIFIHIIFFTHLGGKTISILT